MLKKLTIGFANRCLGRMVFPTLLIRKLANLDSSIQQLQLMASYRLLHQCGSDRLTFRDVGACVYSQNDEDGILLFIFSLIGTTNRKCVEICAGDGIECNTANLIVNHQWIGLLLDGNAMNVDRGIRFYRTHPHTRSWPPKITKAWITKDNINSLLSENGYEGEVDLFSLDIDGNDYWILKELSVVSPRVIVLEFNHLWGADRAVTIPYKEDFSATFTQYGADYAGASLLAFVKLLKNRGYRLVGTNSINTNAFFLRDDIECLWLPEVNVADCFEHPRAAFGHSMRLPLVKDREWIDV